jgi:hypothetical protein
LLRDQAEAQDGAGNKKGAQLLRTQADIIEQGGDAGAQSVLQNLLVHMSAFDGGKDTIQSILDLNKEPHSLNLIDAQAAEAWANAARQKGTPEPIVQKMNDTIESANQNYLLSQQHTALADTLDSLKDKIPAGAAGKALSDALKAAGWDTGKWIDAQQQYEFLRAQGGLQAIQYLKGATSDKDVAFALSGWPGNDAPPQQRARFLRGMSKIEGYNAALDNAKVEWQSNNRGGLGPTQGGFTVTVGDKEIPVPAGQTFFEWSKTNLKPDLSYLSSSQNVPTKNGNVIVDFGSAKAAPLEPGVKQKTVTVDY